MELICAWKWSQSVFDPFFMNLNLNAKSISVKNKKEENKTKPPPLLCPAPLSYVSVGPAVLPHLI